MKNSKFNSLYQETYGRFTQGNGFLVGDVVKLKSGYENAEGYKELGENIKQRLADIVKTKNNLRVGRLHSYDASTRYSAEGASAGPARLADCYEETAPGMWRNLVTVPVACLEEVDMGMNLPPVPDNQKDTRDRVTMPEEVNKAKEFKSKATNQETSTMKKQTHVEKGDYELATKNTKLAHSNKHNDALPPKVKGMQKAKNLSESYASMEDLYINILTEDVGAEGQSANGSLDGGDQLAGNPQIQSEEEAAANNDEAKIDAFVNSLPANYNKPFFKDCLTGMKPGLSREEFQDKLWHNLYAHNLKQYNNDARRAKTATDNKMWYMDDGEFPMEVGYNYKDVFGHFPGSNKDMEEGNTFTGKLKKAEQEHDKTMKTPDGKKIPVTGHELAEEVCPICGKDVCKCAEKVSMAETTKPKVHMTGGDPKDPASAIKASKFSHHGG
jgi:hypothetical protein